MTYKEPSISNMTEVKTIYLFHSLPNLMNHIAVKAG